MRKMEEYADGQRRGRIMFCPSCGKELPDASSFCLHCGKPIGAGPSAADKPASAGGRWALYILAIVGIVAIVVLLTQQSLKPTPASPGIRRTPAAPVFVPQPISEKLFSGQIVVRAGAHVYRRFTVDPTRMRDVRVVGSFRASGGSGNDIQAVLCEEAEWENWINGHKARVLYGTEKTTTGRVDALIVRPGIYYFAFSNTFSVMADKDVFAEIELRYIPQ